MHVAAFEFVREALEATPIPAGLVVEIGGKNVNGSIRSLFGPSYIAIDRLAGPGVDVVADGAIYEPPEPAVCVVCCEVLEHADEARDLCRNAWRMLAPGGVFVITAAGDGRLPHSAVDGGALRPGEFYRNVTEADLRAWLELFAEVRIETNPVAKDIYAVAVKRPEVRA